MLGVSLFIMAFQAVLIASGSIVGKMAVLTSSFNASIIPGLQECTKFLISTFIYVFYVRSRSRSSTSSYTTLTKKSIQYSNSDQPAESQVPRNTVPRWKYALPALLYSIANTAMYYVLVYISPAEYVLLWNTKILFTAVLHRIVLQKKMNVRRVMALGALLIGIVLAEYTIQSVDKDTVTITVSNVTVSGNALLDGNATGTGTAAGTVLLDFAPSSSSSSSSSSSGGNILTASMSWRVMSAIATVFFALVVSFANVFTELIYKRNKASVWEQNMMLYGFGILCNLVNVIVAQSTTRSNDDNSGVFFVEDMWRGLNWWCLALVLIGSCSGIITGLILKYIDVLFVVVADALAVVVNVCLSALLFGLHLTFALLIGAGIIVVAIIAYQLNDGSADSVDDKDNTSSKSSSTSSSMHMHSSRKSKSKNKNKSKSSTSHINTSDKETADQGKEIKVEWDSAEDLDQDGMEIGSGASSGGVAEETDLLIK